MENKDPTELFVEHYLEKMRRGEFDESIHSLIEADHAVIPHLIRAFHNETSPSIRAELIRVIWSHRQVKTIPFLGEILISAEEPVWKSALDGLVTLASPEALHTLEAATRYKLESERQTREFRKWVDEAISQVREALAGD